MIQLEHVNLVVTDLERSLHFYQAAFPHWKVRGGGESSWYGKARKWLHFCSASGTASNAFGCFGNSIR